MSLQITGPKTMSALYERFVSHAKVIQKANEKQKDASVAKQAAAAAKFKLESEAMLEDKINKLHQQRDKEVGKPFFVLTKQCR